MTFIIRPLIITGIPSMFSIDRINGLHNRFTIIYSVLFCNPPSIAIKGSKFPLLRSQTFTFFCEVVGRLQALPEGLRFLSEGADFQLGHLNGTEPAIRS